MRAGQLDRRITLQSQRSVDDPLYGPQPGGWLDFAVRIPAQKQDTLPGNQPMENQGAGVQVSTYRSRIRIRYMRGVTADMRVILHGDTDTIYSITSPPAEIGRREYLEFTIGAYSS
jgi:SPP1 family predicted phage head-tail adaptor